MTKASPRRPPVPTSQTASATSSTDEYDATVTTAKAAAAAAPTEPLDECVLCCYPLPIRENESRYKECCGESICNGCIIAQQRTLIIGTNVKKPIAGSKDEELEFLTIFASEQTMVCPFCRAEDPANNKEFLNRLWNQIDEYNDPSAMTILGTFYIEGERGLSKNLKKTEELFQRAYDLGDPPAAFNLSLFHRDQVPDEARMMEYLEEGARRGNLDSMNDLAIYAHRFGNYEEAARQFMTAARAGNEKAMDNLIVNYRMPGSVVSKDDLATTLRAKKAAVDKVKSEPREYATRQQEFRERVEPLVAEHERRVKTYKQKHHQRN